MFEGMQSGPYLAAAACRAGKLKESESTSGGMPPASTIFFCSIEFSYQSLY